MKIKFLNTTNVEASHLVHATGNDKFIPVFNHVAIDVSNQKLIVTDAHILIEYPIEVTESEKLTSDLIKIVPLRFAEAKKAGKDEFTLFKAIPDNNNPHYVWCTHYMEVGERSECKKSICPHYESKSGRGVCQHRGNFFLHGKEVTFKVSDYEN